MPSSNSMTFRSVKLTEITRLEERKVTQFVLEIPETDQNRVSLQTLDHLREQAAKYLVAVTLTVPDPFAEPQSRS